MERIMNKLIKRLLGFTLIILICGSQSLFAKTKILKLCVPSPPGDWPLSQMVEDMAKKFNERAAGQYEIQVFAGGALAVFPEYMDAVRTGAIDMALSPWSFFSFMDPRLEAVEIPFMFASKEAALASSNELLDLYDEVMMNKFNSKGLAMVFTGTIDLYSKKPKTRLADIKGSMLGVLSPGIASMFKELDAAPMTVPWTDMYQSLQKNIIDSATNSSRAIIVMGMADVVKHGTVFWGITGWNGLQINLDTWKKMPPDIQAILQQESYEAGEWLNKETAYKVIPHDKAIFDDKNITIHILPKAEREKWKLTLDNYIQKKLEKTGDFGTRVKQIADKYNARYPYMSGSW